MGVVSVSSIIILYYDEVKYLSMTLNMNLNWNDHMVKTVSKDTNVPTRGLVGWTCSMNQRMVMWIYRMMRLSRGGSRFCKDRHGAAG